MSNRLSTGATARGRPLATYVFFFATWLLLAAAGSSRMFRDPGTFWHLLTGERILLQGLPHEDWLTFTFAGKPWIAHQWLADCAMALLRRLGGYDALLAVATGGLALLFTWMFRRLVAAGIHVRWAVLFTTLAVLASAGSLHLRPLLLSMAFFAWTYSRLVDVEAGRAEIGDLGWLLPVFIVWVNCHGAVLGGIGTFGLTAAFWLVSWARGAPSPVRHRSQAGALMMLVLGAALTPLVNPYGLEMVRTWSAIVGSPVVARMIIEHGSVWRTGSWDVLPFAVTFVVVFLGTTGGVRWRATSLLPLVWLALTLDRVRHAPLFAMAALLALAEMLPHSRLVARLARRGVEICGARPTPSRLPRPLWLAPLLVLALASLRARAGWGDSSGPQRGPWPFALKQVIEASARAAGPGAPILNDMALGGFLAHEVPGLRIFVDDRCELYGDAFLRDWLYGRGEWFAEWTTRFEVRLALAERGTPLDAYLRSTPAWREVGVLPSVSFFVRDVGARQAGSR